MAGIPDVIHQSSTSEVFIENFHRNLSSVDSGLSEKIQFKSYVQRSNLMSLVKEAESKLHRYEDIYPYIKELCKDQSIDPQLYSGIEKVLSWVLSKGRGKGRMLSKELRNAWITYIVLLSCSMIDRQPEEKIFGQNVFLKNRQGEISGLKGSN